MEKPGAALIGMASRNFEFHEFSRMKKMGRVGVFALYP
jgi:hypothetical protein